MDTRGKGGDEEERDAIEGSEYIYEAEKDTEGADEDYEEAKLGSEVDELEEESSSEEENEEDQEGAVNGD